MLICGGETEMKYISVLFSCFVSFLLGAVLSSAWLLLFIQYFPLSPSAWHWDPGHLSMVTVWVGVATCFCVITGALFCIWIKKQVN
jgi:hypothetical protein